MTEYGIRQKNKDVVVVCMGIPGQSAPSALYIDTYIDTNLTNLANHIYATKEHASVLLAFPDDKIVMLFCSSRGKEAMKKFGQTGWDGGMYKWRKKGKFVVSKIFYCFSISLLLRSVWKGGK